MSEKQSFATVSEWEVQVRPFKEALNRAYSLIPRPVTFGMIASCATDFKQQLAGKGSVSVQSIGHWLTYPGRPRSGRGQKPRAGKLRWTDANARVPSSRDDVWSLVLALTKAGGLWMSTEPGEAPSLDYDLAKCLTSSLGFIDVPNRLLEEAAAGQPVAPLLERWVRGFDSTSPIVMDAILLHLLGDVIEAEGTPPPGLMCVAALSPPSSSFQEPLMARVVKFLELGGSYAVLVPLDPASSPETSRTYRNEVIRSWMEFIRTRRQLWSNQRLKDLDNRLRLVIPKRSQVDAKDKSAATAVSLAMKLVPPFLGEEARPLLVVTHTRMPPDDYNYRVGVMVRGADGARRLTQRYPVEEQPIRKKLPIKVVRSDLADEDRRFRAESDCAVTREFFAGIIDHWRTNEHKHLGNELTSDVWRFAPERG